MLQKMNLGSLSERTDSEKQVCFLEYSTLFSYYTAYILYFWKGDSATLMVANDS